MKKLLLSLLLLQMLSSHSNAQPKLSSNSEASLTVDTPHLQYNTLDEVFLIMEETPCSDPYNGLNNGDIVSMFFTTMHKPHQKYLPVTYEALPTDSVPVAWHTRILSQELAVISQNICEAIQPLLDTVHPCDLYDTSVEMQEYTAATYYGNVRFWLDPHTSDTSSHECTLMCAYGNIQWAYRLADQDGELMDISLTDNIPYKKVGTIAQELYYNYKNLTCMVELPPECYKLMK